MFPDAFMTLEAGIALLPENQSLAVCGMGSMTDNALFSQSLVNRPAVCRNFLLVRMALEAEVIPPGYQLHWIGAGHHMTVPAGRERLVRGLADHPFLVRSVRIVTGCAIGLGDREVPVRSQQRSSLQVVTTRTEGIRSGQQLPRIFRGMGVMAPHALTVPEGGVGESGLQHLFQFLMT